MTSDRFVRSFSVRRSSLRLRCLCYVYAVFSSGTVACSGNGGGTQGPASTAGDGDAVGGTGGAQPTPNIGGGGTGDVAVAGTSGGDAAGAGGDAAGAGGDAAGASGGAAGIGGASGGAAGIGGASGGAAGASSKPQPFMISVVNAAGNQDEVSCANDPGHINSYQTDTQTTTRADLWGCQSAKTCADNQFRLGFERVDATHAVGGRCISADGSMFSGNGTFSARLYVHSNVLQSDGVFTVAMMPTPFDVKQELDLVVINLNTNLAKSGTPSEAKSIDLGAISQRWITVIMEKAGATCTVRIERDGASTVALGTGTCSANPTKNHIVILARARDNSSPTASFVDISGVSWVQR